MHIPIGDGERASVDADRQEQGTGSALTIMNGTLPPS
jgi:hypothetical protein